MTTPHIAGLTFKLDIADGKRQVRSYMTTKLDIIMWSDDNSELPFKRVDWFLLLCIQTNFMFSLECLDRSMILIKAYSSSRIFYRQVLNASV